ncbi:MAG: hypothetical protein HKN43_00895 [Rhodothermales bacterium]|nr:hypothetical protein [Rhodothermales bacterium]
MSDVFDRFRDSPLCKESDIRVAVYSNTCVLSTPLSEVRFWSPQLHLSAEANQDGYAELHGIYGPRPSVWSVFVALYVGIGFLGCMGVIFGLSMLSIGESVSALWAGPIAIAAAVIVYIVGRAGRRFGMDQMLQLKELMDGVLADCYEEPD